jgi:hypothetical protein
MSCVNRKWFLWNSSTKCAHWRPDLVLDGASIPVVLRWAEVSTTYLVIGASYLGRKECRVDRFQKDEANSITLQ